MIKAIRGMLRRTTNTLVGRFARVFETRARDQVRVFTSAALVAALHGDERTCRRFRRWAREAADDVRFWRELREQGE